MDTFVKRVEELLKSLLSLKADAKKDFFVPNLSLPSTNKLPKPSIKQPSAGRIPSGLPPPSKKDPVKVAQQLKNPNPGKVNVEVLKIEDNGQWSLSKADTRVEGIPSPARAAKIETMRSPVNSNTESFANHHSFEQNKLIHGLDIKNAKSMRGSAAGGAQRATNPLLKKDVVLKRASDHANRSERGHLENNFNSAKREVLFHNMARDYFGMGKHVPTTAGFSRGGEDYSAQELKQAHHPDLIGDGDWLEEGATRQLKHPEQANVIKNLHQSGDFHKLALMDHLMGHHDRHNGNYMMDKDNLHLIDNGTSFDYKNFDTKHYPGYLDLAENKNSKVEGMGYDNSQVHPEAVKWLNKLDSNKAKEFLASHGHGEDSSTTQGFLKRLQGIKNAVNNGPKHYGNMEKLLEKNRLTSGSLYEHPKQEVEWR